MRQSYFETSLVRQELTEFCRRIRQIFLKILTIKIKQFYFVHGNAQTCVLLVTARLAVPLSTAKAPGRLNSKLLA